MNSQNSTPYQLNVTDADTHTEKTRTITHTHDNLVSAISVYVQYVLYTFICRNEQFQEELWSISCDLLKDWMSPEIRSKYSTPTQQHIVTQSSNSDGGDVTDKTTTTVDNEDKPPAVTISNDDKQSKDQQTNKDNQPTEEKPAESK